MELDDIKSPLPSREPVEINNEKTTPRSEKVEDRAEEKPTKEERKRGGFNKLILVIPLVVIIALAGVWWLKGRQGVQGEAVINYWGLWEEESVMEGVIADFESKNPGIEVNYTKNSIENYRSRLAGRLQKDSSEVEVPDIFRLHVSWLPMFKDNLETVPKETAAEIGLESDFYQVYQRDLKKDGQYWAVPLMYDGLAMFYNKKILAAAQESVPQSWWGLESVARKVTVKDEMGRIKVAGVAMGSAENVDHWSDIVGVMLKQTGTDVRKKDSQTNKEIESVLTFYTLFLKQSKVWDESLPNSTLAFANEKLAFYFAPAWRAYNLMEMNPGLDFGISPIPQLPTLEGGSLDQAETEGNEQLTNLHWASYWVEGVNQRSNNKKAAFKFLSYLASAEGLERMHQTAVQIRPFGELYPRRSMMAKINQNEKIGKNLTAGFLEPADNASSGYLCSRTFDEGLNDEMSQYFKDAINSIVKNNISASQAVEGLRQGIDQLVLKYQLNW